MTTLQVIEEASTGYNRLATDTLHNQKIESFDFAHLVSEFEEARQANSALTSWNAMNNLLETHLAGSDTAAKASSSSRACRPWRRSTRGVARSWSICCRRCARPCTTADASVRAGD